MKIALLCSDSQRFKTVFTEEILKELSAFGELSVLIDRRNIEEYKSFLTECEVAFSTWGMPCFTAAEIKAFMPKLKALFYAAGSVQSFAVPFLECGVKVFSAYAANAVPVAEYTVAQITLAAKGFYQSSKFYRFSPRRAMRHANAFTGNFGCKVGLVGLGAIGSLVAERLKSFDVEVYAYDPFVSAQTAKSLDVKLASLEKIFSECDVISNHLANKPELENIFDKSLFSIMKKRAVFINTGRGAQVDEFALALHLLTHLSNTYVADVLKNESFPHSSPLFWCPNAVITPHIAGSTGNEPQRMAKYMLDEYKCFIDGEPLKYEVTKEILKKMA